MQYSALVWEHFEHPRHAGALDPADPRVGTGAAQGGALKLQIEVSAAGVIERARFKARGCGATIAAASWAAEWLQGKTLAEAVRLEDTAIIQALALPPAKLYCAVAAARAAHAAVEDYYAKHRAVLV